MFLLIWNSLDRKLHPDTYFSASRVGMFILSILPGMKEIYKIKLLQSAIKKLIEARASGPQSTEGFEEEEIWKSLYRTSDSLRV